ncbi:ABC transporter ATP-binding protein [Pelagibacterium limicola]|uniref:ABC transporter ATP-binding protein n=1 Tax=Pelagibacterium limicola TaxID=2791022 RepID=UPI0018AF8600|nr:sn-glycerol-3-phosphate ABC transporter ATP-binding protein UgpC [Pelagibacterium limicola]
MSRIDLVDLNKSYGIFEVISGLNLSIEDGSFTVFVGPSGCGKSTLLRMIAGLEPITGGDVRIDGNRVNDASPIERGVAMVFQNYALYPHMTVEQNIGFSLRMAKFGKTEIAERVSEAAKTLQITDLLKRKPAQLSGGQRQRVAIGRAIVRDPQAFLFDEPLSNLDAELRVSMRVEIAKLHNKLGATMIYVTHDQTEAMTLADKIVVMRHGAIEQAGSPAVLYNDPANMFVAGFIGSPRMNFLRASASANGVVLAAGPVLPMPVSDQSDLRVGIRPEHFIVQGESSRFDMHVDVVEYLGGTRYLYGTAPSGEELIVEARDLGSVRAGDSVPVGFQPDQALVFSGTGDRIRTERQ